MSREPSLGPLGRSATAATGIQRGGSPIPARRGSAQPGAAQRPPAGNPPATMAVQNGGKATPAEVRTGTPVGDGAAAAHSGGPTAETAPRLRPSRDGGVPALQRELGAHGRDTVRRLLEAGLAEFEEAGFQGARVEDI